MSLFPNVNPDIDGTGRSGPDDEGTRHARPDQGGPNQPDTPAGQIVPDGGGTRRNLSDKSKSAGREEVHRLWRQVREADRQAVQQGLCPAALVVEDDQTTRLLVRHSLAGPFRTDGAATAGDAYRLAKCGQYDLLIVDLKLPVGPGLPDPIGGVPSSGESAGNKPAGGGPADDEPTEKPTDGKPTREVGLRLARRLREVSGYSDVPIVALTGYQWPSGQQSFLEAGFDAFVAKPVGQDELQCLARHLVGEGGVPAEATAPAA